MGLFSDDVKTFTSLSISDIYSKEAQVRSFQRAEMIKKPTMAQYNMDFFNFKKNYRGRYSEKFLTRNGFKPIGSGITRVLNIDRAIEYIKNNYDPNCVAIESNRIEVGFIEKQARFWLQNSQYNWSNYNNSFITEYTGSNSEELCCSGGFGIIDPICCDSDSETSSCDDEVPSCKAEYNVLDIFYSNLNDDPNQNDDLSRIKIKAFNGENEEIESIEEEIPNNFPDLALYIVYKRDDTAREFYHYIIDLDAAKSLFDFKTKTFSAIIPIKENGRLSISQEKTKRMLRKYGITPDDLTESFSKTDKDGEPEVDNAYLMTKIMLRDPYCIKPGTFDSSEVQQYPSALMYRAQRNPDGSRWTLSPELVAWWKRRNGLRRRKFAKMVYDVVNYYESGSTSVTMNAASITMGLRFKSEVKSGVLPGAITSEGKMKKNYTEFSEDETITIEKPYTYFRPCGQESLYKKKNPFNEDCDNFFLDELERQTSGASVSESGCNHQHSDEAIEKIANGGTLPVECRVTVVRRQITPVTYNEIIIEDLNNYIKISDNWFRLNFDGSWKSNSDGDNSGGPDGDTSKGQGPKYPFLIYPLDLLNKLDFMSFVIAKEYGTVFLIYTIKVVVTKWYMKWISVVLSVIMCFLPPGAGCSVGLLIVKLIVGYIVSQILTVVLESIDNEILKSVIGTVVNMVVSVALGGGDISNIPTESYLKAAGSGLVNGAYNAYQKKQMEEMIELRKIEANIEAGERIEDGIDAMLATGHIPSTIDNSANYSFLDANSPDAFYARSFDAAYNYDKFWDFSGVLNTKVNIVSG